MIEKEQLSIFLAWVNTQEEEDYDFFKLLLCLEVQNMKDYGKKVANSGLSN